MNSNTRDVCNASNLTTLPSEPRQQLQPKADVVDLQELVVAIWRGKWFICILTAAFAIAAVFYASTLPNIYRSSVLLAPSEEARGGGIGGMAGQLGGLASLAGVNLGASAGENKVAIAMAVMTSQQFIAEFVKKYGILPELLAVKHWDSTKNTLIYDSELYDPVGKQWLRNAAPPRGKIPSDWEAFKAFSNILAVSQDSSTGFVTIAVEHPSPYLAYEWIKLLVTEVNATMKEKDVKEANRSIEFLESQLGRVALAEMRNVFYQLIEKQTKTIMLAEVRDEYVFSTIDPPVVAEEKVRPARGLLCILITMLGGLLATALVLFRHFLKRERERLRAITTLGSL